MHYWFEQMRRWKTSPTRPQQRRGISWWFPQRAFRISFSKRLLGWTIRRQGWRDPKKSRRQQQICRSLASESAVPEEVINFFCRMVDCHQAYGAQARRRQFHDDVVGKKKT